MNTYYNSNDVSTQKNGSQVKNNNSRAAVLIGIGVLAVVAAAVYYYYKKKKVVASSSALSKSSSVTSTSRPYTSNSASSNRTVETTMESFLDGKVFKVTTDGTTLTSVKVKYVFSGQPENKCILFTFNNNVWDGGVLYTYSRNTEVAGKLRLYFNALAYWSYWYLEGNSIPSTGQIKEVYVLEGSGGYSETAIYIAE